MTSSGTPASSAALLVGGPVRGQVQGPCHQGVPGRGGAGDGDDLAHRRHPPTVPLYWRALALAQSAVTPSAVSSTISTTSLSSWPAVRRAGCPVRGGVENPLLIAAGPGQQVLHPVRPRVPCSLRQRPAVVIIQFRQQAVHHLAAGQPCLPPGEARRDPGQQVIKEIRVRVMVYRCISGCRVIASLTCMITAAASLSCTFGHPLPARRAGLTPRLHQAAVTCSYATRSRSTTAASPVV